MEVRVGGGGHVVVDNDVDALDVNAAAEDVGGNHDALLEVLEELVLLEPLLLLHAGVNGDGGEVALNEEVVELAGAGHGLDEDDNLVELEGVEEVAELPVLLVLGELDKVLLQAVEGELLLVINQDLQGLERRKEKKRRKG